MKCGAIDFGRVQLRVVPPLSHVPPSERQRHQTEIGEIQRFRGRVYLADGAIPASALDEKGRHRTKSDEEAFHFSLIDPSGKICGAIRLRYFEAGKEFSQLSLHEAIKRIPSAARGPYDRALEDFLRKVGDGRVGEVGGWAVSEELRGTIAGILLPLAGWAHCQLAGNAFILATATKRHLSVRILTRLGGYVLKDQGQELPAFFDARYGCELQLLGFDSRKPNPRYEAMVAELKQHLIEKSQSPALVLENLAFHQDLPPNEVTLDRVALRSA